jgi:RNA recognition motif-containing protein
MTKAKKLTESNKSTTNSKVIKGKGGSKIVGRYDIDDNDEDLDVASAQDTKPKRKNDRKPHESCLYISNLSYNCDEHILKQAILRFMGQDEFLNDFQKIDANSVITDIRIGVDKNTGKRRGFAYVDISKKEVAEKLYDEMHEFEILGRKINIDMS